MFFLLCCELTFNATHAFVCAGVSSHYDGVVNVVLSGADLQSAQTLRAFCGRLGRSVSRRVQVFHLEILLLLLSPQPLAKETS